MKRDLGPRFVFLAFAWKNIVGRLSHMPSLPEVWLHHESLRRLDDADPTWRVFIRIAMRYADPCQADVLPDFKNDPHRSLRIAHDSRTWSDAMADHAHPTVYLVEDDEPYRVALARMLGMAGHAVCVFVLAEALLQVASEVGPGCILLDIQLPGLDGLDLQTRLQNIAPCPPIIFLTNHENVSLSVQAMKAGALDFLIKPVSGPDLLEAVQRAFDLDAARRGLWAECRELFHRHQALSPREKEVMPLVVQGLPNKDIAALLGTTERTIKAHRSSIMHKLRIPNLAGLVHFSNRLHACRESMTDTDQGA
jgi:FixJ family two-component response regulator